MKANDFVQAMGQVDEKYVEEALQYKSAAARNMKIWRTIAIAACALLAASAAFGIISVNSGSRSKRSDAVPAPVNSGLYYSAEEMEQPATAQETFYAAQDTASFSNAYVAGDANEKGAVYEDDLYDMAYEEAAEYEYEEYEYETTAAAAVGDGADSAYPADTVRDKKIIYNVYMDMQTKEFDSAIEDLGSLITELGGYCEDQYISNTSAGYRNASYTIRIPAEKLEDFLDRAGQISAVTYMSRSAEDVSDSYYDVQSRLESARTKLKRLQELLEKAEDMDDLITIEEAITDVEWEIDNYGGVLNYFDSHVSYSTVTLKLNEVYEVVVVEEAPLSFGDRMGSSFNQGLRSVGIFFKNLLIWLASSWIWLIIVVVIIIVVIVVIRKATKKHEQADAINGSDKE